MEETIFEKIKDNYKIFMEEWKKGEQHRYRSYDYCKNLFDKYYKKPSLSDEEKDNFALNLYCYLASWGMLRGSSWLLKEKSYRFFVPTVDILFNKDKYGKLLQMDIFAENFVISKNTYTKLIVQLADEIEGNLSSRGGKVSIVLLGKIIMGTYGCVPAYDTYDQKTLKSLGYKNHYRIKTALPDTYEIVLNNIEVFEKIMDDMKQYIDPETKKPVNYTAFKVLDMMLWIEGEKLENNKKAQIK